MKKTHFSSRLLSVLLVAVMIVGMLPVTAFAVTTTGTEIGLAKGDTVGDTGFKVTSLKTYDVAPDIKEYNIITNNSDGTSQTVCNVMQLAQGGSAKAVVGYGNVTEPSKWCFATTTEQCAVWEEATGENVVGGVNASWFNITTGEPIGAMVVNGTKVKDTNGWPYFATFSDGSATIVENMTIAEAEAAQSAKQGVEVTMTGAVAAVGIMVKNGEVYNPGGNTGYYSRTSVGMKADGTIVLFQADGTMAPRSVGYTAEEEAKMMIALGCEIVLQLDEGGSSTFVSQREGEDDVTMRNTPAGGSERGISTTILFVSTAKADGEFDHANITPTNEYYTPNSTVELTASGIDASGAEADSIPETITWALEDDSYGTVTAGELTGSSAAATFVSNGKLGTAVIQMKNGNEVVGTAEIHIQNPDELYFNSDEVALNYGDVSDLGLVAEYLNEQVHLKAGDIIWTMTYEDGYDSVNYPIGTLEGLTFTATSDTKVSCTVAVTAAIGDLTTVTSVALGKAPSIILDGGDEDGKTYDFSSVNMSDLGSTYGINNYGRGAVVSASIIDDTDEQYADIIRFGTKAIRLDFDWTGITGTDGACIGPGEALYIDGAPTAVGAWVYVPDETTPLPWLRMQISTSTDGTTWTNAYVNFIQDSGLDANGNSLKVGWNYVEADLTSYVKTGTMVRINKGMLFRAMVTTSGIGMKTIDGTQLAQSLCKGYIIVDNFCFVYGSNNQDVTSPTVSELSIINTSDSSYTEIEDGMVIAKNVLNFHASYHDNETTDPFATGVESAYFYFDGTYFGSGDRDNLGSTLLNIPFADGVHSVTFYLKDGYGNITRDTRYFTVDSDGANELTSVSMRANGEPTMGKDWHLEIYSDNLANVMTASAEISVTATYPVTAVNFPEGVTGEYTYNADKGTLKISVTAVDASIVTGDVLADIVVDIPDSTKQGATVYVSCNKGLYSLSEMPSYDEGINQISTSFSTPSTGYAVDAAYILTAETLLVGNPGVIHVQTNEETPTAAVDVSVYAGETLLGTTDENGNLTTDVLTVSVGSYDLSAADADGNRSYTVSVSSFNQGDQTDAAPHFVSYNISSNISSQQTITWLSSPKYAIQSAQIRYATAADMTDATLVEGSSKLVTYSADSTSALANAVTLTGLAADTTYYFQVGDGTTWSEVDTFTTASSNPESTNFYVMADIQEDEALAGFSNIADVIASSGKDYAFAVQTGDAVDNVRYYSQWAAALELFTLDSVGDTDWLHVLGNHEVDDDGANGYAGKAIFGIDSDWYSMEYGDVYVAVLNHTMDEDALKQFGAWLVEDAAKSECTWKIFVTHAPIYYTNPVGGGQVYHEILKDYVESAGIDFCFAGNDHSYARTTALKSGAPDEDGTVYYICGSTGGKSYSIVENESFYFDVATIDFTSVYLDVTADEFAITITAYDIGSDGSSKVLDTYTKRAVETCANDEHDYIYDRVSDVLKCQNCGYTTTMSEELYSGYVTDKETGRKMYMVAGKATTGLLQLNDAYLYFDENGLAFTGAYTLCGEICHFVDGAYSSSDNENVMLAGMAGEKAEFVLYTDGRFVMGGSGATFKFASRGATPWRPVCTSIKRIEIDTGITELSAYTFYGATKCTSVTFGENSKLTKIGSAAFYYMSSLTEIVLPNGVTSIGSASFAYCKKLTSVYLPDGVSSINATAFKNCSADLVLSVGYGSYAKQWAEANNVQYAEREVVVTTIASGTSGSVAWKLYADGTLELTGAGATADYAVTADVPWYAYRNQITKVTVGADVTRLGKYSLRFLTRLTTVEFAEGSKLAEIGIMVFYGDTALTEVVLPESLVKIEGSAFANCTNLTNVYVPDGVSKIANTAFKNSPKVVLSVGHASYAKQWAEANSVQYAEREVVVTTIASGTSGSIAWKLYADGTLELTGAGATADYAVTADVPWYAYRNQITKVTVGADVTRLGKYSLRFLTKLTTVEFAEGSKLAEIGIMVFYGDTALTEVVLPENLVKIEGSAFANCTNLTNVYVPDGVSKIANTAFKNSPKVVLSVGRASYAKQWAEANSVQYAEREVVVTTIASGTSGSVAWKLYADGTLELTGAGATADYAVTADVPWYAYRNQITKVTVGADVTRLGKYSLRFLTKLTTVEFAEGSKLAEIGIMVFYGDTALTEVVLPESLVKIEGSAFANCTNLTNVYVPDGVSKIVNTAFKNSPKVVLSVGYGSYAKDWAVTNGVAYVEREATATWVDDTEPEVTEPEVTTLNSGLSGEVTWTLTSDGLLTISGEGKMEDYSEEIAAPWLEYVEQIKALEIGQKVTEIGAYAFYGMTSLETVTFAEDTELTVIRDYAFASCELLKNVVLPEKLETVGEAAFAQCNSLELVELPDSIKEIGVRLVELKLEEGDETPALVAVFDGCTKLQVKVSADTYVYSYAQSNSLTIFVEEQDEQ